VPSIPTEFADQAEDQTTLANLLKCFNQGDADGIFPLV